jgi:hypothetical protein
LFDVPRLSEEQVVEDLRTVRVRRDSPRPPTSSSILMALGLASFGATFPMMFYALTQGVWGATHALTLIGVPVAIGAVLLLAGRSVRRRFRRRMLATDGLHCINCYQRLQADPSSGFCPECREPYDIADVKRSWRYWRGGFF